MSPNTLAPQDAGARTISVVVPSYRRPDLLVRCLDGLLAQDRPADQVVVVRRDTDEETRTALEAYVGRVDVAVVAEPGVLAAMARGVDAATGDVVAFTDDDAVPRPDWLATLLPHYDDAQVGGVGGRDVNHPAPDEPARTVAGAGRFTAWGGLLGFHHVVEGPAGDADVLKGVNMSFRRPALALPLSLPGSGAQVHFEVATSLHARTLGWRLVLDPAAVVDHYHGPRFDEDQRHRPQPVAVRNEAYNLVLCLLSYRPELLVRRAAFGLLVGDRATPGLLRAAAALARRDPATAARLLPSLRGQLAALRDVRRGVRPEMPAGTSAAPEDRSTAPLATLPRLRILHVLNDVEELGNGINNVTVDLACAQADAGHEVTVASQGGGWARVLEQHGVRLAALDQRRRSPSFALAPARLRRIVARVRPDVVHAHNVTGVLLARAALAGTRVPLVATVHNEGPEAKLMRYASASIVLSEAGRQHLLSQGFPAQRIRVLRNGTVDGARSRSREPLPPRGLAHPNVVTVCGMNKRKGIQDLLAALPAVRAAVPGTVLYLVGDGPDREEFERQAEQLALGDAVVFERFQPRPDAWLAEADVFVLASHHEPGGLVLAEAREAGCPIVATDVAGNPNMLDGGRAGLLVPPGEPEVLAAAVVRVLSEPGLADQLRAAAREGVEDLTVGRLADDVERVYRGLLAGR
ncbi:glycosyltransferase involved in cell wall biosynthesis [Motilibacter rhizosphaerae]|uniref:Glycosyltransferase involved in cell wall biosynthesis n=1 Tax=Motilibacter rhizosphaerae TaxID=598652 RepID=A0A4Q7NRX6_9ACTN|nr:glycosyltransferase [Motilibacter rhizosphaerae]RZS87400.1 glycosyltransferase involved in cell wall biosynthesis [Motilibacter rhizosphaerae]